MPKRLIKHGNVVVAIHETPEPRIDVPDCLAGDRLPVIDLTDDICGPDDCRPIVGNVVVYRDKHHLTESCTLSLMPFLDRDLMATGRFDQG